MGAQRRSQARLFILRVCLAVHCEWGSYPTLGDNTEGFPRAALVQMTPDTHGLQSHLRMGDTRSSAFPIAKLLSSQAFLRRVSWEPGLFSTEDMSCLIPISLHPGLPCGASSLGQPVIQEAGPHRTTKSGQGAQQGLRRRGCLWPPPPGRPRMLVPFLP